MRLELMALVLRSEQSERLEGWRHVLYLRPCLETPHFVRLLSMRSSKFEAHRIRGRRIEA